MYTFRKVLNFSTVNFIMKVFEQTSVRLVCNPKKFCAINLDVNRTSLLLENFYLSAKYSNLEHMPLTASATTLNLLDMFCKSYL